MSMWNNLQKQQKIRQSRKVYGALMVLAALLLAGLGAVLHQSHERSVLDIYSEQQDAYVQLVLDQINVLPEKTDEEIIRNILGSLDTSNRKYWALAKDQTLLFVKDVTETNRYKGFTTPTLFETASASEFMDGLKKNQVTHKLIEMGEDRYVASGVVFGYAGSEYRICLLANETVILDNNDFLSSQIALYIYLGLLLILLLLVSLVSFHVLAGRKDENEQLMDKIQGLNYELEKMATELESMDAYYSRWSLYGKDMMQIFAEKLEERQVRPVVFQEVLFENRAKRRQFLEEAQVWLDERVLRFACGPNRVCLMFLQYQEQEVHDALKHLSQVEFQSGRSRFCMDTEESLLDVYKEFAESAGEERES